MSSNPDDMAIAPSQPEEPTVQELVRSDPFQVPEKFLIIRNEEDNSKSTTTSDTCHLSPKIPIIDLSLLSKGHKEELQKLDQACKEWGFFQLVNHGVATQVLQGMKDAAAKFFELPFEEKNKIKKPTDDFQGFSQAHGTTDSEGQPLNWSDALLLTVYPSHNRRPKFWPTTPKGFKEVTEAYSSEVRRVGVELIKSLSLIMGMEKNALLGLHQELQQLLRVNYYPPCSMPDKGLGLHPHSDTGTITILMQEDNVTGLHIRKDGEWLPVIPIPNALVVNVGDAIEIWSNGKYKSIEHRAVKTKSKTRISYASFLFPREDVEIGPFEHLVESSQMYKKVNFGEYLKNAFNAKLVGKAHTQMAKIGN